MIEITVNGTPFTDFVNASITTSLSTMADDFSFTASAVNGFPPLKINDVITVIVDGVKKLTGFIGEVSGSDEEGSHMVTYAGRDKTGDFIDSQIDTINDIKAGDTLTLKHIIEIVIKHLDLDIKVIDRVNPKPFNKAEDIIKPTVGQNAFEFVNAYAMKRQSLLSSTADGDILITQSSPADSGAVLQRLQGADDNNILSQSWSINASRLFRQYVQRAQLDPLALNLSGATSTKLIEDQNGVSIDDTVRAGRQSVNVNSKSYSSNQLNDLAKWSSQLAKAKATKFTCTVKGHVMPLGGVWQTDTLALVNSDVADISRKMLIDVITFAQGEGRHTITTLQFVERDVYTINELILSQRPVGGLNDAFKSLG